MATAIGGAVGLERELSGKPAGLRTNILICLGAAILTHLSIVIADDDPTTATDRARIMAQIVTGIGFLGAGTILQTRGNIHGLTSAATIWVVAAMGMLCGAGLWVPAAGAALLVLFVLTALGRFENWLLQRRRARLVVRAARDVSMQEVCRILEENQLVVESREERETSGARHLQLRVRGSQSNLEAASAELLDNERVRDVLVR